MANITFDELLEAGAHFGHLKRKWNPNMAPYIFMEKNGIHIIDLHKTIVKLDEATNSIRNIARSGKKILFVATKKQAKEIIADKVGDIGMPYVTERWFGGMLTNFPTIRKAVKKMSSIDKMEKDGTLDYMSKRERLQISRQRMKLEKNLGSIIDLTRLPAALFIVDVQKERNAVAEARRLNIPIFAIVDTNSNPNLVDYAIPANDDAAKSIALILDHITAAIKEGLSERKVERDKDDEDDEKKAPTKTRARRTGPRAQAAAEDNESTEATTTTEPVEVTKPVEKVETVEDKEAEESAE
ncbi:MAG: 30S ribosomal protein S2 [Salinivirgaceae bacterium]|nr:30S ribosomal protein S2 [Salinivirgaceae bacterium]MDD4747037.1 30S ribosomal protein S2 [Salinivirgaceae bacterium]MDY0279562.1 30S ribosomal protein S2 [Salinivirgaceae bacterium]